ncbi:unnamed protein product [Schistosoma curassoni]|uniref:Transposase n=1 Tax=Schistosoma curassoni TaxID=6186 RepID=A0A183JRG3_9TREM|nr:unnamed protein product [Schistosoma curassoni]
MTQIRLQEQEIDCIDVLDKRLPQHKLKRYALVQIPDCLRLTGRRNETQLTSLSSARR